jgi:hypothetical protein
MTAYNGTSAAAVALRAANLGGLHQTRAPKGTASPYIVMTLPASSVWKTAGNNVTFFKGILRLTISSDISPTSPLDIAELAKTLFDNVCLSGASFSMVYCHRTFEKQLDPGENLWQYVIHYEVLLQSV